METIIIIVAVILIIIAFFVGRSLASKPVKIDNVELKKEQDNLITSIDLKRTELENIEKQEAEHQQKLNELSNDLA